MCLLQTAEQFRRNLHIRDTRAVLKKDEFTLCANFYTFLREKTHPEGMNLFSFLFKYLKDDSAKPSPNVFCFTKHVKTESTHPDPFQT